MSPFPAESSSARDRRSPARRRRVLAASALAALTTLGLAVVPPAAFANTGRRAAGPADAVQKELDGLVRSGGFPGALAAVRDSDGRTRVYTAGVGDVRTKAEVPADGRVRIASNTKTYVATVVLQLVGEGRLNLDAPVETYLPGLIRGHGNDGRKITIRQILQHTSGLPNYTDYVPDVSAVRHTYVEPRELLDLALAHEASFAPGRSWAYSNTNYIVAALIVQKVTGRPISEEVAKRIIVPLGLRDTYWPAVGEQTIRGAHPRGYTVTSLGGEPVDITDLDPSQAWAAGQLIATPSDMNRFLVALLDGRLLKPEQLRQMQRTVPTKDMPAGWRYGLGLVRMKLSCGGYAWGHGGDIYGYETRNAATGDGRAVTIAVTALPWDDAAAQRPVTALDHALCARS